MNSKQRSRRGHCSRGNFGKKTASYLAILENLYQTVCTERILKFVNSASYAIGINYHWKSCWKQKNFFKLENKEWKIFPHSTSTYPAS